MEEVQNSARPITEEETDIWYGPCGRLSRLDNHVITHVSLSGKTSEEWVFLRWIDGIHHRWVISKGSRITEKSLLSHDQQPLVRKSLVRNRMETLREILILKIKEGILQNDGTLESNDTMESFSSDPGLVSSFFEQRIFQFKFMTYVPLIGTIYYCILDLPMEILRVSRRSIWCWVGTWKIPYEKEIKGLRLQYGKFSKAI